MYPMEELDVIELTQSLTAEGISLPEGTTGTIVLKINENEFLVEFTRPPCVLGVYRGFLRAKPTPIGTPAWTSSND